MSLLASLLLLSTGAAQAQSLTVAGACPGPMDISASGLTPGGSVAVLTGRGAGSDVLPGGPCADAVTDLGGVGYATSIRADGAGNILARPAIGAGKCGASVQFLDLSTCSLTNRATFGGGEAEPFENELWVDGYAYASIDDAPVDAGYGTWINNCQTDPYPLPEGWEIVPNEPGIEDIIFMGGWSTHCMLVEGGCTYGTFNYSFGNCFEPCGLMGDDGAGSYWATSCSRRVMIRRPL